MRFQEEFLKLPSWNGGIDAHASSVLAALKEARFSTEFPSDITIEDADHAIAQMETQDGHVENLVRVRDIIGKLTPVRSSGILFI